MQGRKPSIAIIGAGIGGLTAAACLRRVGIEARIYEQARQFTRLGAGIQQSPNSVKVLRELELEARLRAIAFQPEANLSRDYDSGAITNTHKQGQEIEERYGAPYFLLHRGDLHAALAELVPPEIVERGRKLVGLDRQGSSMRLSFADGSHVLADAVIGADGVHSVVREILLGQEAPQYTGRVAYRTVFPAALLNGVEVDGCVKWWGPDRHIVSYFVNPRRDEIYFVTSTPDPGFSVNPGRPRAI